MARWKSVSQRSPLDFRPESNESTVLPMKDGPPKLRDFPAELGGSGEALAEQGCAFHLGVRLQPHPPQPFPASPLVSVVSRMRWICDRRSPLGNRRLTGDLAAPELVAGQVDLDACYETISHVRLTEHTAEIHIGPRRLATEQVVLDERRDVALTTAQALGRPNHHLPRE